MVSFRQMYQLPCIQNKPLFFSQTAFEFLRNSNYDHWIQFSFFKRKRTGREHLFEPERWLIIFFFKSFECKCKKKSIRLKQRSAEILIDFGYESVKILKPLLKLAACLNQNVYLSRPKPIFSNQKKIQALNYATVFDISVFTSVFLSSCITVTRQKSYWLLCYDAKDRLLQLWASVVN